MIGEKIKEIRKKKGLSLRTVASVAGISPSTLSDIENSKSGGTMATHEKIANALGVNQKIFFEKDDSKLQKEIEHSPVETILGHLNTEIYTKEESFTADLIKKIIKDDVIVDPDKIPDYVIDMIIASLKMELKNKKKVP